MSDDKGIADPVRSIAELVDTFPEVQLAKADKLLAAQGYERQPNGDYLQETDDPEAHRFYVQELALDSFQFRDLVLAEYEAATHDGPVSGPALGKLADTVEDALNDLCRKFGLDTALGDDYDISECVRMALLQCLREAAEEDAKLKAEEQAGEGAA